MTPCAFPAAVEVGGIQVLCGCVDGHSLPHRYRNGGEVTWWPNGAMIVTDFPVTPSGRRVLVRYL